MKSPHSSVERLLSLLAGTLILAGCASSDAGKTTAAPEPAPIMTAPPAATLPNGFVQSSTTAAPPGPRQNPGVVAAPRPGGWAQRHQNFAAQAQKGDIDVLFMGDSITDFWATNGKAVWAQNYAPLKAANFGISADRTQHVLWRLQNGEGQGFTPKVVVLMIGTNNIGVETRRTPASAWRGTSAEAIEGVTAVVNELRKDFPNAKILLLSIFPRGDDLLAMQQIPEVNRGLAKLDDQKHVFYLDVTKTSWARTGRLTRSIS
jgi:beta-glucosidase